LKKMVIEMLLNSDIQKKIVQMILHFQKEINVIIYIKNHPNIRIKCLRLFQNYNKNIFYY
jgi:hypothetical protein